MAEQLVSAPVDKSASETGKGAAFKLAQTIFESPELADAYEALFNKLRLARSLESGNTILVTSTAPGEGKTTVALCLAITASLAGQRSLLIDGDLRRSSLALENVGAESAGLIELLLGELGEAEAADAIRAVSVLPASPRGGVLSIMSGGRKPPIYLGAVDRSKARSALKSISRGFDYVFLDSPPVLAANDALLFAGVVDAVLLVVGTGNANLDEIRRAREQLDAVGTPILGAVLNRFEPKVHGPSNQPYSGHYRRSRG